MKQPQYVRKFAVKPSKSLTKKLVDDAIISIWKEHQRRLSGSFVSDEKYSLSKNENAKNFLCREIYALGLSLYYTPPTWDVPSHLVKDRSNPTTRPDVTGVNIFHDLLMSIYKEDGVVSRQERWTMSRELEYARRHRVPSKFLCGFLYQSGGRKNLRQKLKDGYIEPAFKVNGSSEVS